MSRADELHKWGCDYFNIPEGTVTAMLFHKYLRHLLDGDSLEIMRYNYSNFKFEPPKPSGRHYPFEPIDWQDYLGRNASKIDAETTALLTAIVNVYINLYDNYQNYTATPEGLLKKFITKYPKIEWTCTPEDVSVTREWASIVSCNNEILRAVRHGISVVFVCRDWEVIGCRINYDDCGVARAVELPHIYIKQMQEWELQNTPLKDLTPRYGECRLPAPFAEELLGKLSSSLKYPFGKCVKKFVSGERRDSMRAAFIPLLYNLFSYLCDEVAPKYCQLPRLQDCMKVNKKH